MDFKNLGIAVGVAILLCGCSTLSQSRSVKWPWPDNAPCAGRPCEPTDAVNAFTRASEFCRNVQNYYESRGFYSESGRFGIGLVGVLAGAVGAPLSTGSATKAWTSVSGATNGLQMQMDNAFSGAVSAKRRSTIANEYEKGVAEYKIVAPVRSAALNIDPYTFDSWPRVAAAAPDWELGVRTNLGDHRYLVEDSDAKVIAAVNMATRCAMGAGSADQKALQSLTASP